MAGIRWADFHKWSLVWVKFGNSKQKDSEPRYGLNLGTEFSYRHMAVVVSYKLGDSHAIVVPLTTYNQGDEYYKTNIIIKRAKYPYLVSNDSTILVDKIRHIDKKLRIKKIEKSFIPHPLKREIQKAMIFLFS